MWLTICLFMFCVRKQLLFVCLLVCFLFVCDNRCLFISLSFLCQETIEKEKTRETSVLKSSWHVERGADTVCPADFEIGTL